MFVAAIRDEEPIGELEYMLALCGCERRTLGNRVENELVKSVIVGDWRVMVGDLANGFLDG